MLVSHGQEWFEWVSPIPYWHPQSPGPGETSASLWHSGTNLSTGGSWWRRAHLPVTMLLCMLNCAWWFLQVLMACKANSHHKREWAERCTAAQRCDHSLGQQRQVRKPNCPLSPRAQVCLHENCCCVMSGSRKPILQIHRECSRTQLWLWLVKSVASIKRNKVFQNAKARSVRIVTCFEKELRLAHTCREKCSLPLSSVPKLPRGTVGNFLIVFQRHCMHLQAW